MKRPHHFTRPFLFTALFVCLFPVFSGTGWQAGAQQQSSAQKLYETAKRHYVAGDYRNALETIEVLLKSEPDYAPALLLKSKTLLALFDYLLRPFFDNADTFEARQNKRMQQARRLKEAADNLERFLQLKPDVEGAEWLREQLASLRVYGEPLTTPEAEWTIFSPTDVAEKAQIRRRPEPRYPEEARPSGLNGAVKLLMVLAADRTVKHIVVLQSAHQALTESAIEAARKISFEPAVKDGRPVSTAVSIEYNFRTF